MAAGLMLAAVVACGGGGGGGGGPAPLNISSTTAADGVVGVAYSNTVAVTGGTGARNFTITAGALPDGLTLNATSGAITGTPAGPTGTASFTVQVADSATTPQTDSQALTIDIVDPLAITTVTVAGTSVGAAYSETLLATGGTAPYTFTISAGSLPSLIVLSAAGELAGTVTTDSRSQDFTVLVTDSSQPALTDSVDLSIAVTLAITTTALPNASGGEFYSTTLAAQGGMLPLNWTRIAGALPAGIADPVAATGVISGTPVAACAPATTVFTVQVTDTDTPAQTDSQAGLSLTVDPATLEITDTTLPNGVVGTAYNASVQVAGGVPPYAFALTAGTLPNQLGPIHPATGAITGTPDTVESQSFDVTVTDNCAVSVTETLSITINPVSLGRNNSIATATVLPGNGTYAASISPGGHPNTVFEPDEDFYEISTTANSTVTVDINANVNGSPLDPVIEIVGANGAVLQTCGPAFDEPCVQDDEELGVLLDPLLTVQLTGTTTFYVHVVDFRGDARPDMLYDLVISGVN